MKPTEEKCNAWDCEHNKNGCCMSIEALTECNEGLLKLIKEFKNETN